MEKQAFKYLLDRLDKACSDKNPYRKPPLTPAGKAALKILRDIDRVNSKNTDRKLRIIRRHKSKINELLYIEGNEKKALKAIKHFERLKI